VRTVSLLLAAALLCAACSIGNREPLDLATTTSVQNSGLLDDLLPHFTQATVRVHAAGSGRALAMLSDDVVDVAVSHAPETEARALREEPTWAYRKFAYNHFVVVGPKNDPADVRHAADVVDAFRRIAAAPVTFVSRGDGSGTHEREQILWDTAGVKPPSDRLLTSGRGMAITLRQAAERQGYTLSDEATFWQFEQQLDLTVVLERDPRLVNTYAVVYARHNDKAARFAQWLTRGAGRQRVGDFRVQGRPAFTLWPGGCPDEQPQNLPCRAATK
jgi:tungstate transport system substrate-binding protein